VVNKGASDLDTLVEHLREWQAARRVDEPADRSTP
jgi:hypothetical protein